MKAQSQLISQTQESSSVNELPTEKAANKQNSDVLWLGPYGQHKETSPELHSMENTPVSGNTVNFAVECRTPRPSKQQALPVQGIQLQTTCLKDHCLYRTRFQLNLMFLTRILHFL